MKILAFLAATAVATGAVYFVQSHKLADRDRQIAALQAETQEKTAQVEKLEADQRRVQDQRRELLRQSDELVTQLQARNAASAANPPANRGDKLRANNLVAPATLSAPDGEADTPDETKAGFGKMLAKMMQDPDTKKFIRDQQRMMMNQLYSPLIKQLGLNPEQADRFKDLLADNAIKGAEKATSMFGGASSASRAELVNSMAAQQRNLDDQVRLFLGDAGYAQYKEFQETAGERMQLNTYKQQTGSDLPLTDNQTEQLLAIMKEEKKNMAALTGQPLPGADQDAAKFEAILSGEQSEKLVQSQQTVNQRVLERASAILSPEQLGAFAKFQTNQVQTLRMGLSMARKMMGPDNSQPASNPSAQ